MRSLFLPALLALSLGLNALLLLGLASPDTVAPVTRLLRSDSSAVAGTTASTPIRSPADSAASGAPTRPAATGARAETTWPGVLGDGPEAFVANLRAAGFSDPEVRAMLAYRLNLRLQAFRRSLATQTATDNAWWRPLSGGSSLGLSPQAQTEVRAMARENARLMDSLLGPAPAEANPLGPLERLQYGDLPPAKVAELRMIQTDYDELMATIRGGTGGLYLPDEQARLRVLAAEKEKDIRAVLDGPGEYEEYLLRASSTASSLRSNLALFQPTEDEFRRIFALQHAFDQRFDTSFGPLDPELVRQRSAAQQELNAQIQAVLSPTRAAEYEKATDGAYRQAAALVARLELPPENATQLWDPLESTCRHASLSIL